MKKIDGFWDSSAIVPLCVNQGASPIMRTARKTQSITVSWGTPVEVTRAFARLLRESQVSALETAHSSAWMAGWRRQPGRRGFQSRSCRAALQCRGPGWSPACGSGEPP